MEYKINTEWVYPPIPNRNYDWAATLEGYESGDYIGYGPTEEKAKENLIEQLELT